MMRDSRVGGLVALVAVCVLADRAFGHGTRGSIEPASGLLIQAAYDDGSPMAYSRTEIFPAGEARPFQSGATDRNGRFLFYPDSTGQWKIVVGDGMGHRLVLETEVSDMPGDEQGGSEESASDAGPIAINTPEQKAGRMLPPRVQGAVTGVSLIFGIFGIYCFVRQWLAGAKGGKGQS